MQQGPFQNSDLIEYLLKADVETIKKKSYLILQESV
jgi:hypothetical protein